MEEHSGDISGRRNISWKCSLFFKRSEHKLPLPTYWSPKELTPEQEDIQTTFAGDLISMDDQNVAVYVNKQYSARTTFYSMFCVSLGREHI
jgi:hypothetical protein